MKKLELELLQHHSFMRIFAVPVSFLVEGTEALAQLEINSGKIYLVQSGEFSFWFVPNESALWKKFEEDGVSIDEILSSAAKVLSESSVPAVTYVERCNGPSESDQMNFLKPEFWDQVRDFVEKGLESLEQES